jgi:hypothetical protein
MLLYEKCAMLVYDGSEESVACTTAGGRTAKRRIMSLVRGGVSAMAARRLSAMASRVGDKDNINSSNKLMQQSTGHLPKGLLLLKESLSYPETYIIQMWYHDALP